VFLIYRNKNKSECHKRKEINSPCWDSSSILKLCHHKITHSYQMIDPVLSVISCLCLVNNFILITILWNPVHYPISRVTSDHKFLNRRARRTLHHWAYRLPVHTKQQLVVIASRCNLSFILIIIPDHRCSSIIIVIYSSNNHKHLVFHFGVVWFK